MIGEFVLVAGFLAVQVFSIKWWLDVAARQRHCTCGALRG